MTALNYLFIAVIYCCIVELLTDDKKIAVRPAYLEEDLFFRIVEPEVLSYFYKVRRAKDFGINFNATFRHVPLVLTDPVDACAGSLNNALDVQHNIALVFRGHCSFLTKTLSVQEAGGLAVIIADNDETNESSLVDMIHDGTQRHASIPSLWLVGKSGQMIRDKLSELRLERAVIDIPVNASVVPNILVHQPPWSLW